MAFRFVHVADLHLDSPLKAMALRDGNLADEIGIATRTAFSRIVDLCIAENAAFLLIAGDLWDKEHSSTKTPRFLKQELLRLTGKDIGCFIIRGNHDALAKQTGELDLPEGATLFGGRATTVEIDIDGHRVALHGLSFRDSHAPDSLLPRYPAPVPGAFNIGLMHTSLNGSPGHDNYAPCSVAELDAHGYDYWALGHIHRRAEHVGRAAVVMPGIPQGRDIGEAGAASVTLCHVDDAGAVTLEQRSVASLRFERLEIDCSGVEDWPALLAVLQKALRQAGRIPRPEEHLVLRPMLFGATPLAWRMARDHDRLGEEARAFAAETPGVWIDKVELRLDASGADPAGAGLPADLVRLVQDALPQDPALMVALRETAEALLRDLPPELRDLLGDDEGAFDERCRALLAEGTPPLLARLVQGAG